MKFNLNLPIDAIDPPGEFQTPEAVLEVAQAVDRTRASACALTEHPAPPVDWLHNDPAGHNTLDPFTALGFIAAATKRIKVLTEVIVLPYRNPFLSAKAATTLQLLSGGRFIFGVGIGYVRGEFDAMGVDPRKRGVMTDEALETIRAIWAGGPVVKKGMNFNAAGNEQRPVPSPPPPIWVGGGSSQAAERAARWGDGWIPFFAPPTNSADLKAGDVGSIKDLADKVAHVKKLRTSLGKTGPFDVCITAPVEPWPNSSAQARLYRDSLKELADAGVTWVTVIRRHPTRAAFYENLRWFDEEVMSHFA